MMNNVEKYYWIIDHPKLTNKYGTQPSIELTPQMVNPLTRHIEEDMTLNTRQEWWVEVSVANKDFDLAAKFPEDNSFEHFHDWQLDCRGDSAEAAIDRLYELVLCNYGDY